MSDKACLEGVAQATRPARGDLAGPKHHAHHGPQVAPLQSVSNPGWAPRQSSLPSFRRVTGTLETWRNEILNFWRFPLTDAFVEAKHNRAKVTKRQAYGYRRLRCAR
jgi:hypothetical protein